MATVLSYVSIIVLTFSFCFSSKANSLYCTDVLQTTSLQTQDIENYMNRQIEEALKSDDPSTTLAQGSYYQFREQILSLSNRGNNQALNTFANYIRHRISRPVENSPPKQKYFYNQQSMLLAELYRWISDPELQHHHKCLDCSLWPSLAHDLNVNLILDAAVLEPSQSYESHVIGREAKLLLAEYIAFRKKFAVGRDEIERSRQNSFRFLNQLNADPTPQQLMQAFQHIAFLDALSKNHEPLKNSNILNLITKKAPNSQLADSLKSVIMRSPALLAKLAVLPLAALVSIQVSDDLISAAKRIRSRNRESIERKMSGDNDVGFGLPDRALYTSYIGFFNIMKKIDLPANGHIVDVGSGEARLGLVIGEEFSNLKYTGIELFEHRAKAAARTLKKYPNTQIVIGSFAEAEVLPRADAYFIFNPTFDSRAMESLFENLHRISLDRPIKVIVTANTFPFRNLGQVRQIFPWLRRNPKLEFSEFYLVFESAPPLAGN